MDNLLEWLIPLIFAAIYFFGNMFSGKDEDESAPSSAPRRRNEDEEADAIERQRRIQEEIRRKIMERRRAAQGSSQPMEGRAPARPPAEATRERSSPELPHAAPPRERRAPARHSRESAETASRKQDPSSAIPHPSSEKRSFSWDTSDNVYGEQMQERLQQIEATKRRAEKLKKQAQARRDDLDAPDASSPRTQDSGLKSRPSSLFKGPVRETLTDPAAARAAFIYAEVLGQPISQRKTPSVPGLS